MEWNLNKIIDASNSNSHIEINGFIFVRLNGFINIHNKNNEFIRSLLARIDVKLAKFIIIYSEKFRHLYQELMHLLSIEPFTYYIYCKEYDKDFVFDMDFYGGADIEGHEITYCKDNRLVVSGKPRLDYCRAGILYVQHSYYDKCIFVRGRQLIALMTDGIFNASEMIAISIDRVPSMNFLIHVCNYVIDNYMPNIIIWQLDYKKRLSTKHAVVYERQSDTNSMDDPVYVDGDFDVFVTKYFTNKPEIAAISVKSAVKTISLNENSN